MYAIILAATHDRALNAASIEVPIVLMDLDKDPLLTVLVKRLSIISDLSNIIVVTNEAIRLELNEWNAALPQVNVPIHILSDGTMLPTDAKGAVGDLIFAIDHVNIDDDLIVIGGDNWFTFDVINFVEQSRRHSPSMIVTQFRERLHASRFGLVKMDKKNRITEFLEKPRASNLKLKASCVYFFSASDLKWLNVFAKDHSTACSPGNFFSWLVGQTDVYGIEMSARFYDIGKFRDPNLRGPDFIKLRNIIRKRIDPSYSTWERDAARRLQWVSSYEDILDCLNDRDPNLRIVAAVILGCIKNVIDDEMEKQIILALLNLLSDSAMNQYEYGSFQSDEDSAYYVSATAAESLVLLGYAENIQAVFDKARKEGFEVSECKNIVF